MPHERADQRGWRPERSGKGVAVPFSCSPRADQVLTVSFLISLCARSFAASPDEARGASGLSRHRRFPPGFAPAHSAHHPRAVPRLVELTRNPWDGHRAKAGIFQGSPLPSSSLRSKSLTSVRLSPGIFIARESALRAAGLDGSVCGHRCHRRPCGLYMLTATSCVSLRPTLLSVTAAADSVS